ncbi:hypothetical protein [Microterricola gilva]|nr:hypothetical protein [Microterricola gilva]
MMQFTRSWPALAALGAALLYGAVGAGAIGAAGAAALAIPLGVLWLAVAAGQAAFGLLALRTGSMPAPAFALALFLLPTLLWAALLLAGLGADAPHTHAEAAIGAAATTALRAPGAAPLPFLPLLIASVLALGAVAQSASTLRRLPGSGRSANHVAASTAHADTAGGRFTLGLVVGSLAVSALVTPGLAATDAGRLAVPHGTHAIGQAVTVAAPLSPAVTAGTR